jgi:molybdopterin-guanine dinucleotide biosynthesis protein A
MESEVVGAVLAGGRSSRMGEPKPLTELAGRPLILHPLEAVSAAGLEPVVVAKPDSELPELSARVIREPQEPRHPLLGVVTALRESGGRPALCIPCDMPFVPAALLRWLAGQADPLVVFEGGGHLQPLLGRYEAAFQADLAAAVAAGTAAQEAVLSLGARVVSEAELSNFGPPGRVLFNVNDPSDLAEAERMAAA